MPFRHSESLLLFWRVFGQALLAGIIRVFSGNSWFKYSTLGYPSRTGSFAFSANQEVCRSQTPPTACASMQTAATRSTTCPSSSKETGFLLFKSNSAKSVILSPPHTPTPLHIPPPEPTVNTPFPLFLKKIHPAKNALLPFTRHIYICDSITERY